MQMVGELQKNGQNVYVREDLATLEEKSGGRPKYRAESSEDQECLYIYRICLRFPLLPLSHVAGLLNWLNNLSDSAK